MVPRITPDAATADGAYKAVQGFREGTISTTTFLQRLLAAGMVYGATFGSATTPLTSLTTYTALRPEFVLRGANANTMYIPMEFGYSVDAAVAGTINEWSMLIGGGDPGNGTSTAATVGPINYRTDKSGSTATAIPRGHYTADATVLATPSPLEIWRTSQSAIDGTTSNFPLRMEWNPAEKPMLAGLCGWEIFQESTGSATTYFANMKWAETPLTWWN